MEGQALSLYMNPIAITDFFWPGDIGQDMIYSSFESPMGHGAVSGVG
jgi:hypothetical protein